MLPLYLEKFKKKTFADATGKEPAHVADWSAHSAAMCSSARPPTRELFLIIPMHMMNRELISGQVRGFDGVLYKL